MRKAGLIIFFLLSSIIFCAQKIIIGTELPYGEKAEIRNQLINIDTNFQFGKRFHIKKFNEKSVGSLPILFCEYFNKKNWIIGIRSSYFWVAYDIMPELSLNVNNSYVFSTFTQRGLTYRLYFGKEFFSYRRFHPFICAGATRYQFLRQKFQSKNADKYDYNRYEKWMEKNLSSINVFYLGLGISKSHVSIAVHFDRTLIPINYLVRSYNNTTYCSIKYNFFSAHSSKRIPLPKANIETNIFEQAFVPASSIGLTTELPLYAGLELERDTVTGFNTSGVDFTIKNHFSTFEGGWPGKDRFVVVQIRKKSKVKFFSPLFALYHEKSIRHSSNWYIRNSIGYRYFSMLYSDVVTEYSTESDFLSTTLDKVDIDEDKYSLRNTYSSLIQEHKIGYRFSEQGGPNYLSINAGVRMNWTIRHWNAFTARIKTILPTLIVGANYKIKRLSLGINLEHSIFSPDKNGYYRYFYCLNSQVNYDIYRSRK